MSSTGSKWRYLKVKSIKERILATRLFRGPSLLTKATIELTLSRLRRRLLLLPFTGRSRMFPIKGSTRCHLALSIMFSAPSTAENWPSRCSTKTSTPRFRSSSPSLKRETWIIIFKGSSGPAQKLYGMVRKSAPLDQLRKLKWRS